MSLGMSSSFFDVYFWDVFFNGFGYIIGFFDFLDVSLGFVS